MKKKLTIRFSKILIPILILFGLALTAGMVCDHLSQESSVQADTANGLLENVYITNSSDGTITFLYDGNSLAYDGTLAQEYEGIADVEITDGQITKLYTKSASVTGTVDAFTDEALCITGYGWVPCRDTVACYCMQTDGSIVESAFSDVIIGVSTGTFIFDHGNVCAFIWDEAADVSEIRVLLKNGDSIFRETVYLTATEQWFISGSDITEEISSDTVDKSLEAGEIADADTLFSLVGISLASDSDTGRINSDSNNDDSIINTTDSSIKTAIRSIECPEGLLYLCDADGNRLSEGYDGIIRILRTDNGYVLVNQLPLEDYVRYVLPSEMPLNFSYEALKAQAVCARTFACSQMKSNVYAQYGANLDDSTSYQVFNASGTNEQMDLAVSDTAGQVLTADGELIVCYYFSTSAGFTNTTDVWGNSDSPNYLIRKSTLLSQDLLDLSVEETFTDFISSSPESYDSASPFYRWNAVLNLANITDSTLGTLESIAIVSRSESGYVTELSCNYEGGKISLTNENVIRRVLGTGLKSLTLSDGSTREFSTIPSACFAITGIDGYTVTLTGGGFGHGIGMSQYGADAMGDAGWTYEEILEFYYEGAEISSF